MGDLLGKMKAEAAKGPSRLPCTIAVILAALTPEDRADLEAALADRSIGHRIIAEVLSAEGHPVKQGTVSRHRGGQCSCKRDG